MKIGLLSRHHMYHHGAMLQAYALQTVLASLGHNVEIIDYRALSHERANKLIAYQLPSPIKNISFKNYLSRSVALDLIADFGFKLETTIEDGLKQFMAWYKEYFSVE